MFDKNAQTMIRIAKRLIEGNLYKDSAQSLYNRAKDKFEQCFDEYEHSLRLDGTPDSKVDSLLETMHTYVNTMVIKDGMGLGECVYRTFMEESKYDENLSVQDILQRTIGSFQSRASHKLLANVNQRLMHELSRTVSIMPLDETSSPTEKIDYKRYLQTLCILILATSLYDLISRHKFFDTKPTQQKAPATLSLLGGVLCPHQY